MLGNTVGGWGICHSFAEDGRCISLLKVMLTNYCIYDCAYCINRRSNDLPRATLSVAELVDLTMEFYRRNYIEELFLNADLIDAQVEQLMTLAEKFDVEYDGWGTYFEDPNGEDGDDEDFVDEDDDGIRH